MMSRGECDLCANPYPYMCAECDSTCDSITDEPPACGSGVATDVAAPVMAAVMAKVSAARTNLVWIGSGDSGLVSECMDFHPVMQYS